MQEQFLNYVDTDLLPTRYNSKNLSYKDWFTFKIITSDTDDCPIKFECGVKVDGKDYRTRYYYESNQIEVNTWDSDHKKVYITNQETLPEKIKPFVRSLFRYLRKSFDKAEPT